MVKDNHLLAKPDLAKMIQALRKEHPGILIELEADSLEQVREFVQLPGVNVILLDNINPAEMRACVALRRSSLSLKLAEA